MTVFARCMKTVRLSFLSFDSIGPKLWRWLPWVALGGVIWWLLGGHLIDAAVPPGGVDLRAHLAKIYLLRDFIQSGLWPVWNTNLYLGFPPFQHYPPLFHFLGAALAVVVPVVVSYKLLLVFNIIIAALTFSWVAQRWLGVSKIWAHWASVIYAVSHPLIFSHLLGNEPNMLGWHLSLLALVCFSTFQTNVWWAVGWLVLSILTHPFPVIFLAIVTAVHLVICLWRPEADKKALVFRFLMFWGTALLLTSWWWLPGLFTINFLSPLAEPMTWWSYNSIILIVIMLAGVLCLWLGRRDIAPIKFITIGLIVSVLLAVMARQAIPVLGHFLHNFRFANLGVNFFSSLGLLAWLSRRVGKQIKLSVVEWAVPLSVTVVLALTIVSWQWGDLASWFGRFTTATSRPAFYAVVQKLGSARIVIPPARGSLSWEGSLVSEAMHYGFSSVTGPYSQGDPKFFRYTVHLEWEERWLDNKITLENVLGAAAADYVFLSPGYKLGGLPDTRPVLANDYGQLYQSPVASSVAIQTMPALLDVPPNQVDLATSAVNLFLPHGFELPLVDKNKVSPNDQRLFPLVVTTDPRAAARYPWAKGIFIISRLEPTSPAILPSYRLPMDLTEFAPQLYQGPDYDYRGWIDFDFNAVTRQRFSDFLNRLSLAEDDWNKFLKEQTLSVPAQMTANGGQRELTKDKSDFVLLRESWFPNWKPLSGKLWPTTQGFMLVYDTTNQAKLFYQSNFEMVKNKLMDYL